MRSAEATQKLSEVIGAAEIVALPSDATALGGVLLMKTMLSSGEMGWTLRHFGDLSAVEVIGALTVTLDQQKAEYAEGWEDDGDG